MTGRSQVAGDHLNTARVGVDAVRETEVRVQGHAFQQEGIERHIVRSSGGGKDGVEDARIGADPGRSAHAAQQHPRRPGQKSVEDRVEVGPHAIGRDRLHQIIGAQGDDAQVRARGHGAIQPPQAVTHRIARDAAPITSAATPRAAIAA